MMRAATRMRVETNEKGAVGLAPELGVPLVVAAPGEEVIVENGSSSLVVELLAAA